MCQMRSSPLADAERALLTQIQSAVREGNHAEVTRLDRALRELTDRSDMARPRLRPRF